MTDIAVAGGSGGHPSSRRERSGAAPAPHDSGRFVDTLLATTDRQLGTGGQRSFGGGTMPQTVERFGAHGFFAGSVPVPIGETVITDIYQPRNHFGSLATASFPPTQIPPHDVSPPDGATPLVNGRRDGGPAAGCMDLSTDTAPAQAMRPPSTQAAVINDRDQTPVTPLPLGDTRRVRADAGTTPPAASRAASFRPRAGAESTLAVSLGRSGAGVTVSVTGGPIAASDEQALHRSVAQLLARHGLVLNELRVARQPSADGRHRGNG